MDINSRPVIVAPLVDDEQGRFFKTLTHRIEIPAQYSDSIMKVIGQAEGLKTIAELAESKSSIFTAADLVRFFNLLEAHEICYEAHHIALFGHRASQYPDPRRVIPGDHTIRQLMRLPPDRDGELLKVAVEHDSNNPLHVRQTQRRFTETPLSLADLSRIAFATYGLTGAHGAPERRTVPSAGAMYPLQIDYIVRKGDGIAEGIYRWAKHSNGFIRYRSVEDHEVQNAFPGNEWREAAVIQTIGFDIVRSTAKYSSRAYRFALLEAGHAAQNAMNEATQLSLGVWEYGGEADDALEKLVELQESTCGIATVLFFGHPR